MDMLRVSLFGRLEVRQGEQALPGLEARKAQELFCYLLLYRDRPHPRETLADLLWGNGSAAQSRQYLRKALWQLHVALNRHAGVDTGPVLLVEPEWIQIVSGRQLWVDVVSFDKAFDRAQGVAGRDLEPAQVEALKDAVHLYRGDLLEGWYQDWCLYERERLQHAYLTALDKLMSFSEARRDFEAGLFYGTLIFRHDRARERAHRRLMRLYYLAGDRTEALRQYERCVTALREELDVGPSRQTLTLYEKICADQLDEITMPPPQPAAPPAPTLSSALDHLRHARVVLMEAQRQVKNDILAVESVIKAPR